MSQLVDSHIHLAAREYLDIAGVKGRALRCGVGAVIAAGSEMRSNEIVLRLHREHPGFVYCCIGLHPESTELPDNQVRWILDSLDKRKSEIVALGEVGLPYYSTKGDLGSYRFKRAAIVLRLLLERAADLELPAVLHAPHNAALPALQLLEECGLKKAMFHWHKAPLEVTEEIVKEGFYLSVTPEIFYEERDKRLVSWVPLNRLLIETDGPWPFEKEFSGTVTEPCLVRRVAERIAEVRGETLSSVTRTISRNCSELFGIDLD